MPLADELFAPRGDFNEQLVAFPQVGPIVGRLRDAVRSGTGIEAELDTLRREAQEYRGSGVQLNAVLFYLRAVIMKAEERWTAFTSGVSNYGELLTKLRQHNEATGEPVRVVTFNYDTLIDSAFSDALQIRTTSMAAYISRSDFRLYKVHGSTSWVNPVNNDIAVGPEGAAAVLIELGRDLQVDRTDFGFLGGDPTLALVSGGTRYVVPAMAVPLTGKGDFVMPPLHIRALGGDLPRVRRALVIGWKGADQQLLDSWRTIKEDAIDPDLLVVSSTGAHALETAERLGSAGVFGRAEAYLGDGFSDFLADANKPLERFLARGRPA
jgi:hypothetical protein